MRKYYTFKVNQSKIGSKELQRQINLACMRIKNKTGYTGIFDIKTGFNGDDFINDKITVRIQKQYTFIK